MKKVIFFLIGCLACLSFADPTAVVGSSPDTDLAYIYYHAASTFTDSNTVVINANDGFVGIPQYMLITTTGTDTSFEITLMLDPTELGETQVATLFPISAPMTLSTANTPMTYVIPAVDISSNTYGSFPAIGKLYIRLKNASNATLSDLKIWIFYDPKKAPK